MAEGMSGGLSYGAGLGAPTGGMDGGPQFNAKWVKGRSNYYDGNTGHTNDRSVRHYSQNISGWVEGDTAPDQLTWGLRPEQRVTTMTTPYSFQMFSWSTMNYRLKHDPEWRNFYGQFLSAAPLKRDFAFFGVQQSKQTLLNEKSSYNDENNFIIIGRARMPNMWLAATGDTCIGEGASLYVLWRRHEYTGNAATTDAVWDDPDANTPRTRAEILSEAKEAIQSRKRNLAARDDGDMLNVGILKPLEMAVPTKDPLDIDDTVNQPLKPAEGRKKEYYWSIDPFVTYDKQAPSPTLYMGDPLGDPYNHFVGDFDHIGMVTHVLRGDNARTPTNVSRARAALYPATRSKAHLVPYFKLDCVEVMVKMGK